MRTVLSTCWISLILLGVTYAEESPSAATINPAERRAAIDKWLSRAVTYGSRDDTKFSEVYPFWPEVVRIYALAGLLDEAKEVYDRVDASLEDGERLTCLGDRIAGIIIYEGEGERLESLLAAFPESFRIRVIRTASGISLPCEGKLLAAERLLQRVNDPTTLPSRRATIVERLIEAGRRKEAMRILSKVTEDTPEVRKRIAELKAMRVPRPGILDREADPATAVCPQRRDELDRGVSAGIAAGSLEEAEKVLHEKAATETAPSILALGYRQLAWIYISSGETEKAERCAALSKEQTNRISIVDRKVSCELALAELLFALGDAEAAKDLARKGSATTLAVRRSSPKKDDLKAEFAHRMRIAFYDSWFSPLLIDLFVQMDLTDDARRHAEASQSSYDWHRLGWSLARKGDFAEIERLLQEPRSNASKAALCAGTAEWLLNDWKGGKAL